MDRPRIILTRTTKRKHYCCKGRALTKGCHTKTLPKRVTQFRFSHCTLRIVYIHVTPIHLARSYTCGEEDSSNLHSRVMGQHMHMKHSRKFRMAWGRCEVRSTRRPEGHPESPTLPCPFSHQVVRQQMELSHGHEGRPHRLPPPSLLILLVAEAPHQGGQIYLPIHVSTCQHHSLGEAAAPHQPVGHITFWCSASSSPLPPSAWLLEGVRVREHWHHRFTDSA